MFPVHWFLAKRAVRARSRGAAIHEPWLLHELTALARHIAADPIDRACALERLGAIIRRLECDNGDDQHQENPS